MFWALGGLLLFSLCCFFNGIKLGIAVFETTCSYVKANPFIFALPAITTLVSFVWYVIWLIAAIWIFSVGTPQPRDDFPFITEMMWEKSTRAIFTYHIFGLLWINSFIIGAVQFVIAASTVAWYYDCNSDNKGGHGTILKGFWWLFRYNWPSIAMGSCIIAIC